MKPRHRMPPAWGLVPLLLDYPSFLRGPKHLGRACQGTAIRPANPRHHRDAEMEACWTLNLCHSKELFLPQGPQGC